MIALDLPAAVLLYLGIFLGIVFLAWSRYEWQQARRRRPQRRVERQARNGRVNSHLQ